MPIDLDAFAAAVADSTAATAILAPRATRAAATSGTRTPRVSIASRFLDSMRRRFAVNVPREMATEALKWTNEYNPPTDSALTPDATLTSQLRTAANIGTLATDFVVITAEAARLAGFANRTLMARVVPGTTAAEVLDAMVALARRRAGLAPEAVEAAAAAAEAAEVAVTAADADVTEPEVLS